MNRTRTINRTIQRMTPVTVAGTVGLATMLTLGVAQPVAATPTSTLFVGGGGIAADDGQGNVVVEGPALVQDKHLRTMLDATISATMTVADGTLPTIGECESAAATFVVTGERDADMTLTSEGTVCRVQHPNFPSYITVQFDGQHTVVEAKRPQLRGGTGSLSINISPGGFTSLYADSFVPTT
jgi:hypothetical protein